MKLLLTLLLLIALSMANTIKLAKTDGTMSAVLSQVGTNIAVTLDHEAFNGKNMSTSVACVNTDKDFELKDGQTAFMTGLKKLDITTSLGCYDGQPFTRCAYFTQGIYKSQSNKVFSLEDLSSSEVTFPGVEETKTSIFMMSEEQFEEAEFPDGQGEDYAVCFTKVFETSQELDTSVPDSLNINSGFEKHNVVVSAIQNSGNYSE